MSKANINKGHVHFGTDNAECKENAIVVQENTPGSIQVHLGFLQFQHIYRISINVPKAYFRGQNTEALLAGAERSPPNINCKLLSFEENKDTYNLAVEFYARKEKLLKEELGFTSDLSKPINIVFNARVLGPGKGTPLLKEGIKCIGVDADEMSEASDWQGFD